MKHSPGPWRLSGYLVKGPRLNRHGEWPTKTVAVAIQAPGTYSDESLANGRLIAAAPELVEALELARSRLWTCNPPVEDHVEERINAVLAKVKGETT